jgi:hypothetical protein
MSVNSPMIQLFARKKPENSRGSSGQAQAIHSLSDSQYQLLLSFFLVSSPPIGQTGSLTAFLTYSAPHPRSLQSVIAVIFSTGLWQATISVDCDLPRGMNYHMAGPGFGWTVGTFSSFSSVLGLKRGHFS